MNGQNGKTNATRRKILTRLELEGGFSRGELVTFQVDTGATSNVLTAQDLPNDVTLKSQESSRLSFFNGTQKDSLGTCEITVKIIKDALKAELDRPVKMDVISEIEEATDWTSQSCCSAQAQREPTHMHRSTAVKFRLEEKNLPGPNS